MPEGVPARDPKPIRTAAAILAVAATFFGLGWEMLGSHPIPALGLVALGLLYLIYELITAGPFVENVPPMLRFLAAVMAVCILAGIVIPRFRTPQQTAINVQPMPTRPATNPPDSQPIAPKPKQTTTSSSSKVLRANNDENPVFLGTHKPGEGFVTPPGNSSAIIDTRPNLPLTEKERQQREKLIHQDEEAETRVRDDPVNATLHDLYLTDFLVGLVGSVDRGGVTLDDGLASPFHVEYSVLRQMQQGIRFAAYYISYTKQTVYICLQLAQHPEYAFGNLVEQRTETQKSPGDSEELNSDDLVTSKRVFIYHETYLSPEEVIEIRNAFRKQGFSVILRDSDYLETKKLELRVKHLKARAH